MQKRERDAKNKGKRTKTAATTAVSKPGRLVLKNQRPKYQITDPSGIMAERKNVTLQVSWNVQPWVGALLWDKGYLGPRVGMWMDGKVGKSRSFDLPALKGAKPEVVKDPEGPRTPKESQGRPVTEI